ncbi:hypothetical protein CUU64_14285 [Bacillus sp. V5-8f]|nr:hypothetical protein CUU64_14285 [Bacillus sp. V5-8f]
MSITHVKKKALSALHGKWGKGVLLTFILFFITAIVPAIIEIMVSGGFSNWLSQERVPVAADVINIVIAIILIPLSVSAYWFFLSIARMERPLVSEVFGVYKDGKASLQLILVSLLMGIFVFLWSLLLIIPGIIKSLSYSQTFFIMRDHPEYSPLQAISESKRRMKGFKWKYFLMNLSFIGWGILCVFTMGIGFLWLAPYISTSMAAFYNELIEVE